MLYIWCADTPSQVSPLGSERFLHCHSLHGKKTKEMRLYMSPLDEGFAQQHVYKDV